MLGGSNVSPKKPQKYKRLRFYATLIEQNFIEHIRQFTTVPFVKESVTKALLKELEYLEMQREYMKQEGQENTDEYRELLMSMGPLELVILSWKELIDSYEKP